MVEHGEREDIGFNRYQKTKNVEVYYGDVNLVEKSDNI